MIFGFPTIIRSGGEREEKPFDLEKSKPFYDAYCELITEILSKHGLEEWLGQENDDPWSAAHHYFCRTDKKWVLGIIPYNRKVAVAEIVSEPGFAFQNLPLPNSCYNGLELRVIDETVRPVVEEFCLKFEEKFNEKPKIY